MCLNRFGIIIFALGLSAGLASAANFSFTGTFVQDDQLEVFLFTAPSPSFIAETLSYAGGTNALNQLIPNGGFDPWLSVFDATGGLIASSPLSGTNNDGPTAATDPVTNNAWDSQLALSALSPGGTYALVLSQDDNQPAGPTGIYGEGFTRTGQGNFTPTIFPCIGVSFCDSSGAQRTGFWAVDILGVDSAIDITNAVPEPASMLLLGTGIAGLALIRRRRKQI